MVRSDVAVITGASGFIGSRLRDALLDQKWDVVALTRKGSPVAARGRSVEVDYADTDGLARLFERERPAFVFHVAGATKGVNYADYQRANVMPTRNLATALRDAHADLQRFVHVSSLTAYGPSTPQQPLIESFERKPIEYYGQSKLEAELVLEREFASLPWTILRPGGVYGPKDVDYFELFKLASRGLNLFFGNRHAWASMVHVDDLVQAALAAANSGKTIGKGYFICDGTPRTWGELQSAIVSATGKRALDLDLTHHSVALGAMVGELLTRFDGKPRLFNKQKAILGKQIAWTCKHDSARADFDYRPRIDLRAGVAQTLDWYKSAGWL
ncbi:MAG TPA: NAD(P)-dependent oxidoreductase [Polyangiales bacterium]|nr:NAD(P)-dependent oxidoreductase [Polyangiales bacterium]